MISKPTLLQISLEGEASQLVWLLSILAFVIAALALITTPSLRCISHELLVSPSGTLQSPARTIVTIWRSTLRAAEIWDLFWLGSRPIGGSIQTLSQLLCRLAILYLPSFNSTLRKMTIKFGIVSQLCKL